MSQDGFNFIAYRLNKSTEETLWSIIREKDLVTDNDVMEFLLLACDESLDQIHETDRNKYKWSIRKGMTIDDEDGRPLIDAYVIGRSLLEKDALVVDSTGFHEDRSISTPAPAETMTLLVYWKRHIVLVENRSQMTTGETWLRNYDKIMEAVSEKHSYRRIPKLDNIPPSGEMLKPFLSLRKVTRLKVHIKLPNPDLTRMTRLLKKKLEDDAIQEIKQDMYNPNGLSQAENGLPHASLSMAELGYKSGPAIIEGVGDGGYTKLEVGSDASKGSLSGFREFVKGLRANAKTKEGKNIIEAIDLELKKIVPSDE